MSSPLVDIRAGCLLLVLAAMSAGAGGEPGIGDEESVRAALERAAELLLEGLPEQALAILRPVEEAEPDNPWLWFYRGSAYLEQGEPYRALDAYDRASGILDGLGNPDPELAENIRRHRHRARQQVLRVTLHTGLAYDTNVSFLGSGAAAFALVSGRPDGKFGSQFQIDYAPLASAADTLTFGARLGHSWHFSVQEFNLQDYGGYVRYARRLGRNWEASIRYDYDFILLNNDSFLGDHVLTPSLAYHWAEGTGLLQPDQTTLLYRFESADYRFEAQRGFDQDARACGMGVEQAFKLRPVREWDWNWDLAAGYRFDAVSTDGSEFDRDEHNFYLGLGIPLINPLKPQEFLLLPDKELMFRFAAAWQIGDYRNHSDIDVGHDRRSDLISTYSFQLSQVLVRDASYGDVVLHGIISWTDANSNVTTYPRYRPYWPVNPFTYDKVVYGVQLEWSW